MLISYVCRKCYSVFLIDTKIENVSEACPICFPLKMKNTEKFPEINTSLNQLELLNLTLNSIAELNELLKEMNARN